MDIYLLYKERGTAPSQSYSQHHVLDGNVGAAAALACLAAGRAWHVGGDIAPAGEARAAV